MIHLIRRLPGSDGLHPHLDQLLPMTRSVSRQLNAWIESLKNGGNRGPRYQSASTRNAQRNAQRTEAFLKELERIKNQAKNGPPPDHEEP
jgi:hypothetical protein